MKANLDLKHQKTIKLRPYQNAAVIPALNALRSKNKQALVVMATGLGKTITVAAIAKEYSPKKKILFLVHNNYILTHAIDEFRLVFGSGIKMATYNGQTKKGVDNAQIVFATWQ